MLRSLISPLPLVGFLFMSYAQSIVPDHWETIIFASDSWHYATADSAPATNWRTPAFNPAVWPSGFGGIGYGDGDDLTVVSPTRAIFMRRDFMLNQSVEHKGAIFHADYDDSFVAYINGNEIARANIGTPGQIPAYDDLSAGDHEAQIYQGGSPSAFYISPTQLNGFLNDSLNVLAVEVHNRADNSSDMSGIFFLTIGVDTSAVIYSGQTHNYFFTPFFSSNLPILRIDTEGQNIPSDNRIVARLAEIDHGPGQSNTSVEAATGYDGFISIEKRGSSSLWFDKNNFGMETQDSLGDNLNVSLLGLPSENDWILHGPYSDKSLMRNALTYELGRRMGDYAPRTIFCELLIDYNYRGVYVLTEKIKVDNDRLDLAKLNYADTLGDELTGGYIFKVDRDPGTPESGWYSPYEPNHFIGFHHPSPSNLHPTQKNYLNTWMHGWETLMNSADYADPETGYRNFIDVQSFADHFISNELAQNVDAYRLSAFLHKKKDTNGGLLYAGPLWDFNLGYGNADYCRGYVVTGFAKDFCGNHPFWWQRLLDDPYFDNELGCRWAELRQGPLQVDSIHAIIDSFANLLDEAQVRNFEAFPILSEYIWPNEFIGNTYEAEVNYLKTWIADRIDWLDIYMPECTLSTAIDHSQWFIPVKAYPNPFAAEIQFDFEAQTEALDWEITDLVGQVVHRHQSLPGQQSWTWKQGKDLSPGIYLYSCRQDGKRIASGRLVKSH